LVGITTSPRYNRFKTKVWNMFPPGSHIHNALKKTANAIKHGILQQSNLFESFRFRYFGPIDGNDVRSLVKVLRDLQEIGGPKLLHTLTVKGKGYLPAELDQPAWHAPGKYDLETGRRECGSCSRWQDVFGETLLELARQDERIVGITPAMPTGSSLNVMMDEMPERTFDVGIAEGHAVTFAAGLASAGMVPFCTVYSSFLQRAYDNVIHDVAIESAGVVLCVDRGGLVGEDGTTHQGVFDVAALLPVPNIVISSPMDEIEMRNLMFTASRAGVPFVIRYPRGNCPGAEWRDAELAEVPIGKGRCLRSLPITPSAVPAATLPHLPPSSARHFQLAHSLRSEGLRPQEGNHPLALLSFGPVGNFAAEAAERAATKGISVAHYDLRFAKPLDEELLHEVGAKFRRVITIEDGAVRGGVGSAVADFFSQHGYATRVEKLGVGDEFVPHGSQAGLYRLCGYDTDGILAAIASISSSGRSELTK
jgi:1-deoxy-D-xylulose-5-phosphate synthase